MPQDSEVSTIEVYQTVMKPMANITEVMKHVTLTAVRPLIHKLYNSYLKLNESDSPVGKYENTYAY